MSTIDATFAKAIRYDRETKDYAAYLDGEYVGHFLNYSEADRVLDELVYDLIASGATRTASELDGGSDVEEIAADTAPAFPCCVCGKSLPCPGPAACDDCRPSLAFRCDCGAVATAVCSGAALGEDGEPKDLFFCDACNERRCIYCGSTHMAAPDGRTVYCLACGRPWLAAADPEIDIDKIIDPRDGPCPACDGPHHIQRCGELLARLFAPDEPSAILHQLDGWGCEPGPLVEAMAG